LGRWIGSRRSSGVLRALERRWRGFWGDLGSEFGSGSEGGEGSIGGGKWGVDFGVGC
jgi:hypothetical protein